LVVEALRLLIGELHHLASPVRESFVHLRTSPACRVSPPPLAVWSRAAPNRLERAIRLTVRDKGKSCTSSYAGPSPPDNAGRRPGNADFEGAASWWRGKLGDSSAAARENQGTRDPPYPKSPMILLVLTSGDVP